MRKLFSTLKKHLSNPPVLVFPDFTREFASDTDASNQGVGSFIPDPDRWARTSCGVC